MYEPRVSGPVRVALVGATGLIGRRVIEIASAGDEVRVLGIARREAPLPPGARIEMFVSEPEKWGDVLDAVRPRALICALGTTWKKAGRDQEAFRAVDQRLVLATAEAERGQPSPMRTSRWAASHPLVSRAAPCRWTAARQRRR